MSHKPLDHEIETLICQAALIWRRTINRKVKALDITDTQRRVLGAIELHPAATQIQIASDIDIEPQNLMRALDSLEKRQWIIKKTSDDDRRIKCLFLTPAGKRITSQIKKIRDEARPKILEGLTEKQLQLATSILQLIRKNLMNVVEIG